MRHIPHLAGFIAGLFVGALLASQASAAEPLTLERIHADPPLQGRLPVAASVSPGGKFASYLQPSAEDSDVLELWARPLPRGAPRRLATAAELLGTRSVTLTEAEKMALERRRMLKRGITGYVWCGEQDSRLIVPLAGGLYLVDIAGGKLSTRRISPENTRKGSGENSSEISEAERDPRCDRSGTQLAFVRGNDLWVQPLDGGAAARRLTTTGSDTRSTGLADFIAAEELDRFDGYWWSRDSTRLLALEVDESAVPLKSRMQIRADGSQLVQQRYPAAGEPNARVQPLVITVASGNVQRLALPPQAEYISRAGWFEDGTPWVQWMPRDQTALHLVEFAAAPAAPRELVVERDPAWVEAHDDLTELTAWPLLSGKPGLLWTSERSGRRQLWLLDRVSGALQPLSQAAEPVSKVVCANATGVVYVGVQGRGMGRELFVIDREGHAQLLGAGPSERWRTASGDHDCQQLLVTASAWGQPPSSSVVAVQGSAAPVPLPGSAPDPLLAQVVPQVQALTFMAADGRTPLNALYMPPLAPSSKRAGHAVIVSAYGGPGVPGVAWAWRRDVPLMAHWQRLGFGVLIVENRGALGRDRDFTRAHWRNFGKVEVDDLFATVRQLPALVPGVDPARIGLTGWSYGGYLAARAMLDAATPFAAAVAGAPVTDWTLYDTAYTERYLGSPAAGQRDGGGAYRSANLPQRSALLRHALLLMHGTADDNVLFEHSLRLMQALQAEGKLFETAIYPGQTHGLGDRAARLHADRTATDFLVRHLQP